MPTGTYSAKTKETQIDIGQYKYLDTSALYTQAEATTGKKIHWDVGSFTVENGSWIISESFRPNKVLIYGVDSGGYSVRIVYDGSSWTGGFYKENHSGFDNNVESYFVISSSGIESGTGWSGENGRTFNYVVIDE